METMLATATRKVEAIYYGEEFAGVRIDGKPHATFHHGSSRQLVRIGREIMKLGYQSTYEGRLFAGPVANHPNFWPLTGWGKVDGHRHSKFGWVTQQILPLKRTLTEYTWDEWQTAYEVILPVAHKYRLDDIDLWRDYDGSTRAHNWSIFNDIPIIYDYGI